MIEWKDEALKAAWEAMFEQPYDGTQAPMIGAALDAAVEKQFDRVFDLAMTFAYESGYRDGMEDAAEKERDTLRNLLWEAREQLWLHGPDTLCARIDDALNEGGEDE